MVEFVIFDDDETSHCGQDGDVVESSMSICALFLLLCCVSGLQYEDALDEEEDGS